MGGGGGCVRDCWGGSESMVGHSPGFRMSTSSSGHVPMKSRRCHQTRCNFGEVFWPGAETLSVS